MEGICTSRTRISLIAMLGFGLALASAGVAMLSPIGYRLGWWDVHMALLVLLKFAAIGGLAAFAVSPVAMLLTRPRSGKRGFALAVLGFAIGASVAGPLAWQSAKARRLPLIHDITTDTVAPPGFVALAGVRKAAPNGADYAGEAVAHQQAQAYPEIAPHESTLPPAQLFARAEQLANDSGWTIAEIVPAEGRIEATATSLLFGFKDDIVIRIAPTARGSRLDMRSASRVGRSDVGVNAARIGKFLAHLTATGA